MPGLLVVSIDISDLQTHAIMGKNGSGKSTLSKCLVGHPDYEVTEGTGKSFRNLFVLHAALFVPNAPLLFYNERSS